MARKSGTYNWMTGDNEGSKQKFSRLNRPIHYPNVFVTPVKETCHGRIGLSAEPLLTMHAINRAYFWLDRSMPTIAAVSNGAHLRSLYK